MLARGVLSASLAALWLCAAGGAARAQGLVIDASGVDDPRNDPEEPGEEALAAEGADTVRVPCLEDLSEDGNPRKGVQVRPFLKRLRVELSALGGLYASDALSSSYTVGGALAFYPSEDFGLEVLISRSPILFKLEGPYRAFDGLRRFEEGAAYQAMGSLLYAPFHAKFKLGEETIVPGDLVLIGGAGRTFHESVQGVSWNAGVGLKLYLWKYLTFRLDLRDFILPQEVLGQGRVTHNLVVLGGLSGWSP